MTRRTALMLALLVTGPVPAADPPPEPLKVSPRPLEEFNFPPGTIVVVRSDSREGLGKIDAVVLSPDEYRKLLSTIDQLKKKIAPDKPQPPGRCRISGRVETRGRQEVVKIKAVFDFVASGPRSAHFLGFRRAAAVSATLDGGKMPALSGGADGYVATVDSPGPHSLTMELELPLATRGTKAGERGVTLNLPGSPITVVDQFELPAGVESVRLRPLIAAPALAVPTTIRTLPASELLKPAGDWPALALGAVEGVELFWDNPAPQKVAERLLTADGEIRVQIGDTTVQTTAGLLLKSLRGRVSEWRLQTPPGADVVLPGPTTDAGLTVTAASDDNSRWVIRSRDGGLESLTVEIQVKATRQPGKPVPIGPFQLAGAFREQGTIRVVAPNQLRPQLTRLRSDVGQREPSPEAGTDTKADYVQALYVYGQSAPSSAGSVLMYADAEKVRGELRTQVSHQLTPAEGGWRLVTDIKASPIRTDLEFIEIEIPAVLHPSLEVGPRELVEKIERVDAASNRWQIRLAHPRRAETTVRLEAFYPRPEVKAAAPGGRQSASLVLPRILQGYDRDGQVTVAIPEGCELRGALREWDRGLAEMGRPLEELPGKPPTMGLAASRSPAVLDLSWAPLSAAVSVQSVVDLTLEERQATARQRLTLPKSPATRQIVLQAGGPSLNQVRVVEGGTLAEREEGGWLLTVPASPEQDSAVVLAWSWPIGGAQMRAGGQVDVRLLWPVTTARSEMRMRVWVQSGEGLRPSLAAGPWEELATDPVSQHESLPALVLHAAGPPVPLTLALTEAAALAPAGVIAEKVLIQVTAGGDGQQHYVARFLLRRVAATFIDLELPVAVAAVSNLEIFLAGKRLDQAPVVDASGGAAPPTTGRVLRVPLTGQRATAELAVSYFLATGRSAGGPLSRWRLDLTPPRLRGPVFVGAVRWYVQLPGDTFVLPGDERVTLNQRWGLRRFLPAPVPVESGSDLERWFSTGLDKSSDETAEPAAPEGGAIVRQARIEPIQLIPVPRMLWLLACSLAVLAVCGGVILLRRRAWLFWSAVTLVLGLAAAAALRWPQTAMTFAAGTPPGWLVLALLLFYAEWQTRRYRRRVVFMPGFTRTASPSSASIGSGPRRRDPSTVDVTPAK